MEAKECLIKYCEFCAKQKNCLTCPISQDCFSNYCYENFYPITNKQNLINIINFIEKNC